MCLWVLLDLVGAGQRGQQDSPLQLHLPCTAWLPVVRGLAREMELSWQITGDCHEHAPLSPHLPVPMPTPSPRSCVQMQPWTFLRLCLLPTVYYNFIRICMHLDPNVTRLCPVSERDSLSVQKSNF